MKTHRVVERAWAVVLLLSGSTPIGCAWAFGDLAGPRPLTAPTAEEEPSETAPEEAAPAPPPGRGSTAAVKVEYNETADRTTVILQPMEVDARPSEEGVIVPLADTGAKIEVYATAGHPGRRPTERPEGVSLVFACEASRPLFSYGVELELRIDGESTPVGVLSWDARTGSSGSRETMEAEVPFELVARVGAAQTVEARLGDVELRFGPEQREAFRDFTEALTPAP